MAQASAGSAATGRPAITVYVVSRNSNTVTPVSAAANEPRQADQAADRQLPHLHGNHRDGKSVYVAHNKSPELGDTVTPISTAVGKADGISRGRQPAHQVVVIP